MTLRIKCPACERQFRVGEELKGRTVECGGCEHRFKLDEDVLVARREKFYPGEVRKPGLEGFGRSQSVRATPIEFETAAYNQTQSVADFIPITPQQMVATALGVGLLGMTIVLLILGTQPQGVLKDMEVAKRAILALFMVAVGVALLLYGCHHRKRTGYLVAVIGAVTALALAFLLPVPRTIEQGEFVQEPSGKPDEDRRTVPRRKTAEEMMDLVGYGPVKRAIASRTTFNSNGSIEIDGASYVCALWVPVMEERFKFQILKYLQRKTRTEERPSFYRRDDGGLFVIDGTEVPMETIAALAERFGRVEETYPEIRLIEVTVEGGRLIEASTDLMAKLTDRSHPAFYVRNLQELDHIDLDRVDGAVRRLAEAEPLRFRVEISRRLGELMEEEETDSEFKGAVCRALAVWSEPGDGSDAIVAASAREILAAGETMPRSMLEFLVSRKSAAAVPILESLWVAEPNSWEPILVEIGPTAEDAVLKHLGDEGRAIRQSSVRLLKRIGTKRSIEPLRGLLATADDEMKILLEDAIESLEGGE